MTIEFASFLSGDDRASAALRRGREIAERVRSGMTCTDREYRFLAALYDLTAVRPVAGAALLAAC